MTSYVLLFIAVIVFPIDEGNSNNIIPCDSDGWIYTCDDGNCISDRRVCDGVADCLDRSDERSMNDSTSTKGVACTIKSATGAAEQCILPYKYVCDGYSHCMEDECDCWNGFDFRCSSSECIPYSSFCDGERDCSMGQDEMPYVNYTSYESGVKCLAHRGKAPCVLSHSSQYRCDEVPDCITGADECFCDQSKIYGNTSAKLEIIPHFDWNCFRCLDQVGEMYSVYVCDGFINCDDLSDECLCEDPISTCDQLVYNSSDCEFLCKQYPGGNFTGSSNETKCIKRKQICDGNRDCFYGEDEKYCPLVHQQKIFSNIIYSIESPEYWCCNGGYPADCLFEFTYTNESYDGCEKFYRCPEGKRYKNYQTFAFKCDGIATCSDSSDECVGCSAAGNKTSICDNTQMESYKCPDTNTSILPWSFCDGYAQCNRAKPNESADEKDCKDRFHCSDPVSGERRSHEKSRQCDCHQDCMDGSDEMNCTTWKKFCCRNQKSGISIDQVCDGKDDCSDGSDECQSCIKSPFADDEHLLKNKFFRYFVWIIGIISIIGNIFVFGRCVMYVHWRRYKDFARINSIYVIALSLAELCTGVYLLSLGIVDVKFSPDYCYQDKSWRSGKTCSALGVLALFGTEASTFILLIMSLSRLYSVMKPFSPPNIPRTVTAVCLSYIVAFTLSILPVVEVMEDYFISRVRFKDNPFLRREINRINMSEFAKKFSTYQEIQLSSSISHDGYSWKSLFQVMAQLNKSFVPEYQFGFYSPHGVCLPKFFSFDQDPFWCYSMSLVMINFTSFLVMVFCYVAIYRLTSIGHDKPSRGIRNKESSVMQRRILLIILTNFCCGMPICIMAFITFAGVKVSDEMYALAAIVVLPINSALNPFIYSNLPAVVTKQARLIFAKTKSKLAITSFTTQQ